MCYLCRTIRLRSKTQVLPLMPRLHWILATCGPGATGSEMKLKPCDPTVVSKNSRYTVTLFGPQLDDAVDREPNLRGRGNVTQ
jgi:hypothetical protein